MLEKVGLGWAGTAAPLALWPPPAGLGAVTLMLPVPSQPQGLGTDFELQWAAPPFLTGYVT